VLQRPQNPCRTHPCLLSLAHRPLPVCSPERKSLLSGRRPHPWSPSRPSIGSELPSQHGHSPTTPSRCAFKSSCYRHLRKQQCHPSASSKPSRPWPRVLLPRLPCSFQWSVFRNRHGSNSPSRQQSTITRPSWHLTRPSFGPNPVRTPKSGHVFGKGRSTSPTKPTLDRPAGTGWASGIVRTERERLRVGSFANIPYEVRFSSPLTFLYSLIDFVNDCRLPDLPSATTPNSPSTPSRHRRPPTRCTPDAHVHRRSSSSSASVTANGPANRALNMLSEMSTPLSNARASPSLAPFTTLEIPPVQKRRVKVPIPASRAVAASKQKEVKDTIAALRAKARSAPYSTVHPSTTPSRKILSKRQEDEADNNEDDMFEFVVEPLKKGKENAKPAAPWSWVIAQYCCRNCFAR
jgi:hypothetical protein